MKKQNNENAARKAFARLAITSVFSVLICIICISSGTYAWFTGNARGENNIIRAADACMIFADVEKVGEGGSATVVDMQNNVTIDGMLGEYTVTMTLPKESSSGYLIIAAGGEKYYSQYIRANYESDQTLSFTIRVLSEQSVTFAARWGIYSGECDVGNSEVLVLN